MKYVIIKNEYNCEVPIIFSDLLSHSDVALKLTYNNRENIISAGFCYISHDSRIGFICYDKSTTLDMYPRTDTDAKLLNDDMGLTERINDANQGY